jgi:STE24 endopeptidase
LIYYLLLLLLSVGFWKSKRIVLYDTLINHNSESQVVAVLGHEIGHWALNHTIKGLILSQIQMLIMFYIFGKLMKQPALFTDFGFKGPSRPTYIGLLFFQCIYSPIQHVLSFLMNVVSRTHEFQADAYGTKLGYGADLKEALVNLQKENKGTMIPDHIYSAYHHSHPPLLERLNGIDKQVELLTKEGKKTK